MKEIVIFCQYFVVGKAFFPLTYKKGFSNGQEINVPLFPIITQQFPCSLKVILRCPLFPKTPGSPSKWFEPSSHHNLLVEWGVGSKCWWRLMFHLPYFNSVESFWLLKFLEVGTSVTNKRPFANLFSRIIPGLTGSCWCQLTDVFSFIFREKKKEKEREELWKQLEKLELDSKNSNPAGSNPNPGTSGPKSWTPAKLRLLFCSNPRHFDLRNGMTLRCQ